jgi:hypothetical protein
VDCSQNIGLFHRAALGTLRGDAWGGGDWGERVFCIDKSHVLVGDHVLVFFVAFVLGLASVRGMSIGLLPTMPVPDLGL